MGLLPCFRDEPYFLTVRSTTKRFYLMGGIGKGLQYMLIIEGRSVDTATVLVILIVCISFYIAHYPNYPFYPSQG